MRLRTVTGLIALLVCLQAASNKAEAQGPAPWVQGAPPGGYVVDQTAVQASSDPAAPFGTRYRLYSEFGDGVGFNDGQTYVNVFHPFHINPNTDLVFLDGRIFGGHGDDSIVGGNFGIGYRRVFGYAVAGVSTWVDAVDVNDSHSRIGVSGELVFPFLEARANGYFGIGDQSKGISSVTTSAPTFQGNQIVFLNQSMAEYQYDGFDAELGGPIPGVPNLSAYFGGYYISTDDGRDSGGFRFRAEAHVNRNIQVGLQVSDDSIFDTNVFGTVALTLPTGRPSQWWRDGFFRPRDSMDELARPVGRQYRIPVEQRQRSEAIAAINPADGDPFFIIHIDPAVSGGGSGTFEDPFGQNAFVNNANADIIRVLPGTLATDGPITLQNTQRLLAATRQHLVTTSRNGTFALPDQRSGTVTLTNNLGGSTVILANSNEVSGFSFTGTGIGISGTNTAGYDLNNNVFTGLATGIQLVNANGTPSVVDASTFTGNDTGLRVTSTTGGASTLTATNNNFSNNTTAGASLSAVGTGATLNVATSGNTFDGNDTGLQVASSAGGLTAITTTGDTFTNNNTAGAAMSAGGAGAVLNATSTGNTFTGNGNGLQITTTPGGTGNVIVSGDTYTGNTGSGVLLTAAGGLTAGPGTVLNANVDGSTFSGNGNMGVRAVGSGVASTLNVNIGTNAGNTSTGDVDAGFGVLASGSSVVTAAILNNTAVGTTDTTATTGPVGDGFYLERTDGSTLNATVGVIGMGNTAISNAGHGLHIVGNGINSLNRVNISGNTFLTNNLDGAGVDLSGDAAFILASTANNYVGNTQNGLRIATTANSSIGDPFSFNPANPNASASSFDGDTFTSNGLDGVDISAVDQSWNNVIIVGTTQRTTVSGNGVDGVQITNDATPTVDGNNPTQHFYTIQGTDIFGSGDDGVQIFLTGGESAVFPNINVTRFGGNTITIGGPAVGQDVSITGNGDQGINFQTAHSDVGVIGTTTAFSSVAGTDVVNLDTITVSGNGGDGVQVVTNLLSSVNLGMLRSRLVDNGGIGFEGLVNDTNGLSVFNIGSNVAGTGNVISGNSLQGLYLQTLSPIVAVPPANTGGNIASTFLSPDPQVVQNSPTSGLYADAINAGAFRFVVARMNVFGNTITNNGLPGNAADGAVFSVGTNTNMVAAISGNTFGGNEGFDLRIVNVASQNPNPSINNITPNVDLIATDPVGELDLALGLNFVAVDPPVSGEVPTGANPNIGESFAISTIGFGTPLLGRTENGLFTNADIVKPTNRHSFMVVRVYDTAPSSLNSNVFVETGAVFTTIVNANQTIGALVPGTPFFGLNTIQFQAPGTIFP